MLGVDDIRDCLEGYIPSSIATASADGEPNVTFITQVEYVDSDHVALSFQFFNKTRENILVNPRACVHVIHPYTGQVYRLHLHYLRTELSGPLFERMRAQLAGIASFSGMAGVFHLQGADIYRVDSIDAVPGVLAADYSPRRPVLSALRRLSAALAECTDLESLFETCLQGLAKQFAITHSMFLVPDAQTRRLYTVATHGYEASGVGSEIAWEQGVIGIAAAHRTPVRMAWLSADYAYVRAVHASAQAAGVLPVTDIAFPGLPDTQSQMAVPICAGDQILGVIYCESPQHRRFAWHDEESLLTLSQQLALCMQKLAETGSDTDSDNAADCPVPSVQGQPLTVRYYADNGSVFLDDDYLIKGVAGTIFWALVNDVVHKRRCEFSNRELRLDARLGLPELSDNLEARLILLARRLQEKNAGLGIEKTGRGRFRLRVERTLLLQDMRAGD